jgi:D-amino-acid dehydrogenase
MKIAVIGAGIIGVTTAYELARDGHDVTVLERRTAVAEESSFANAGIVAPGYITSWTEPGLPSQVIRHLFSRHAPLKVGLPLNGHELAWLWKWSRACKLETFLSNRSHLQHLAFYSRERLQHLTADLKLEFERNEGYMVLLRTERDSKQIQPGLQAMRDAGVSVKELGETEARKIETALNQDTPLFGAVHLPDDAVGNCRQFAHLLKNEAQRLGVKFLFNATVAQISPLSGLAVRLSGEDGTRQFDAAVLCAGPDSAQLLAPLGIKIPLAPVYGYSITASIREPLNGPRSAVMDAHYKVDIARMGNRVRVAGCAEFGGPPDKKNTNILQTLYKVLHTWFPGAANLSSGVQEWKGARPMLPDGMPLLGASGVAGLWLNLGHGASGWALSCGSARALADQIGGRLPDLDTQAFGVNRLRH